LEPVTSTNQSANAAAGRQLSGAQAGYAGAQTTNVIQKTPAEIELLQQRGVLTGAQAQGALAGLVDLINIPGVGTYVFDKVTKQMSPVQTGLNQNGTGTPLTGGIAPQTNAPEAPRQGPNGVSLVPEHYVPANQVQWNMKGNEDAKNAALHDGANLLAQQRQSAIDAQRGDYYRRMMDEQINSLPKTGALAPGAYAPAIANIANKVNSVATTLGTGPIFPPNDVAAAEEIGKDNFQLGAKLASSLGHEPGMIVNAAIAANPSLANSAMGYKRISSSLDQANQYEADKAAFYQDYFSKYQHLYGAKEAFDQLNPLQHYVDRAITNTVDPIVMDRLKQYGPNPKLLKQIDETYGAGVGQMLVKKMQGGG
jgi:hypothetical protein